MSENRHAANWKKKIPYIVVALIVILSVSVVLAVYHYKSIKSAENDFLPAEISNAVQENGDNNENPISEKELQWQPDNEDTPSAYTAEKKVCIKNVDAEDENNTDAYIRVCIIPRWVRTVYLDADGNEVDEQHAVTTTETDITNVAAYGGFGNLTDIQIDEEAQTYQMGAVTFQLDKNWNANWTYNEADGYFYYKNAVPPGGTTEMLLESVSISQKTYTEMENTVFLRVDILSDSIQTEGGAVESRWSEWKRE